MLSSRDPTAAAEFHKKRLGQYYLEGSLLPTSVKRFGDLDLRLLQPFFNEDPAVDTILDNISNQPPPLFRLMGISGCGKTGTIMILAQQHFVVYVECSTKGYSEGGYYDHGDYYDHNFSELVMELSRIDARVKEAFHAEHPNFLKTVNLAATNRILKEYLARLIVLHQLLIVKPDLTPLEFVEYQQNGGVEAVDKMVKTFVSTLPAYP